ncbi:AGE family epimerase/isomerase [Amaricoccus macauensis]|uniref:AGE family epimerase/isomerase n=1 Tax=Amaricoccus macauensis TaxID=57001 RepID=UPI003C79B1FF
MPERNQPGDTNLEASWIGDPGHIAWLKRNAEAQFSFFEPSLRKDSGYDVLDLDGTPLPRGPQELHTTTRLVHSYALGQAFGHPGSDRIVDAGLHFLWHNHRDPEAGGYAWSVSESGPARETRLAYGHVFVLLAASSAKIIGHPDADRLLADISEVIDRHFWDEDAGLLREEFNPDWTPFSDYRGMNANMHGVEAHLGAFEATGDSVYLTRAGRILDFFIGRVAPAHDWRIPEHYRGDWTIDPEYSGDPMFRPAGTTPGHSFELARLLLQHWDLSGRPENHALASARALTDRAMEDAWLPDGGLAYTLGADGKPAITDRYWWPVTEAIGVLASLIKTDARPEDESRYRQLWQFADQHFIDHERGGWFPEIDDAGRPIARQFLGKPDIYHSLQATLYPAIPGISRHLGTLA